MRPVFSFQYLATDRDFSLEECSQDEKAALSMKLVALSQLTWVQIRNSPRHGLGTEKIEREAVRAPIPAHVGEDVSLLAFRWFGMAPMVGYRQGAILHILWLDRKFKLYDHG